MEKTCPQRFWKKPSLSTPWFHTTSFMVVREWIPGYVKHFVCAICCSISDKLKQIWHLGLVLNDPLMGKYEKESEVDL